MTRGPSRPQAGRVVAGVCAALARAWDIDVTLLRLAFLLLALAWGLGVILYVVAWLVIPPAGGLSGRRRSGGGSRRFRSIWDDLQGSSSRLAASWSRQGKRVATPFPLTRRWMGLSLVLGGLLIVLGSFGLLAWITPVGAIGLAAMAMGAAMVANLGEARGRTNGQ